MTSEQVRAAILEGVNKLLDDPAAMISWRTSICRTTQAGDPWETYDVGRGQKIIIEIPCQPGETYNEPT